MNGAATPERAGPSIPQEWIDFERSIGPRIRVARMRKGMGLAQLAQRLGISYQQLHKYEVGSNRISIARLAHIAQILQVQLTDLLLLPLDPLSPDHADGQNGLMAARLIEDFGKIKSTDGRELVCKLATSLAAELD
ncbi:Helix-turn-helix [Arboricoccus pini]|uniref:Helix-turn-helix n=1 Tax=Arboricoccus pini TaxID=1963835 RepID=A0A212RN69_9PROT|nr:helix-turn-helix transcriptional regulator [Arboricoccus pini]SNB73862.1 Helix-turn-helix [Arboricoccus pini]